MAPLPSVGDVISIAGNFTRSGIAHELICTKQVGVGGTAVVYEVALAGNPDVKYALKISKHTEGEAMKDVELHKAWKMIEHESRQMATRSSGTHSFFEGCSNLAPILDAWKSKGRVHIHLPLYYGDSIRLKAGPCQTALSKAEVIEFAVDVGGALRHMQVQRRLHL